ncbi:DUF4826 family protein [Colwellia sp. M166]|uniref:DUF4826 family protein n=1 Tax=Colwellia sp. M166 TaxID=2583805 RepID=UPI00211EEFE2|nr:DUF4826 family protein [Colwellia sp. M166]|tara:strand:+ start:1317 stop:1727 length:411 start_codon:yes stop_codon:yes gene_type:complete
MTDKLEMTEEQKQIWIREQYLKATKYLAEKGLVTESVAETESRYLVPVMALWKINLLDKTKVWVVSGDLPTDHIALDKGESARDVVRHFSFKWQLQAENLLRLDDKEQKQFAEFLIGRADGLYQLYDKDELWQEAK